MRAVERRPVARSASAALVAGALAGLAPGAAACPTCGVAGSGVETLAAVMGFLIIPYVIVSAVWWCMKRVIASEHEDAPQRTP